MLKYPPTLARPVDTILIHAPTTLLLAILLQLDWIHNGFIALKWIIHDQGGKHFEAMSKHVWQAVIVVAAVNVVVAIYTGIRRQ